jgi:hypothetical protein
MKRSVSSASLGFLGLLVLALPSWAHHSDAGRYTEETIVLSGTVVALQLVNPHSLIIMDVAEDGGSSERWQVEMGSPRNLAQTFGWTRETLKPGDRITVTGRQAKTGAPFLNLTERAQIRRTESGEELYRTNNYEGPTDAAAPATAY